MAGQALVCELERGLRLRRGRVATVQQDDRFYELEACHYYRRPPVAAEVVPELWDAVEAFDSEAAERALAESLGRQPTPEEVARRQPLEE